MKTQTKNKTNENHPVTWRLVLLQVSLVLLMAGLSGCNSEKKEVKEVKEDKTNSDVQGISENNTVVATYVSFVEENKNQMSLDHAYTNEALLKLTEAVDAMAGEIDYDVEKDLSKVREYAAEITKDPSATTHADNIKKSAKILSDVLKNMQRDKYPGLESEVEAVEKACDSIDPNVLTLDQKDKVKTFFENAAEVLEKMN